MIYYNMKYIIYKIQINDYIYIGSTQNFTLRKADHKRNCNNGKDVLVYNTIRENGGWQNCTMVPVREVEVETKLQARVIEEEERIKYNAQMNTNRAYLSEEQNLAYRRDWREANNERVVENKKKWCEANQEREAETKKKWREANKEREAETNKLWREANRERYNEYMRKYRAAKKAEQSSPSIV